MAQHGMGRPYSLARRQGVFVALNGIGSFVICFARLFRDREQKELLVCL
jgi:hypothetical protein